MSASSNPYVANTNNDTIYFWKHYEQPYGVFSQWLASTFTENDYIYTTAEAYMMHHKAILFNDVESARKILDTSASDPHIVKALGKKVKNYNDSVWNAHKYEIVVQGNRLKFGQDQNLNETLLGTGNRELVEASPMDRIWGIGFSAKDANDNRVHWGENLLGKALMQVRDEFRKEEQ